METIKFPHSTINQVQRPFPLNLAVRIKKIVACGNIGINGGWARVGGRIREEDAGGRCLDSLFLQVLSGQEGFVSRLLKLINGGNVEIRSGPSIHQVVTGVSTICGRSSG